MARKIGLLVLFLLLFPWEVEGQQFKKWEAEVAKYKEWLEVVRSDTHRFWVRLDSQSRPHRLYVGEGFYKTDPDMREEFVETFSRYLAGHPEKFMLIDIFDAASGKAIGEFGWGGFKLYPADPSYAQEFLQVK